MISIEDALKKVSENSHQLPSEIISVNDGLNRILAEDVFSPIPMPPFSQSAMDGYAVSGIHDTYTLVNEIQAGDTNENKDIDDGQASRIFTGAILPKGTTAVVMQEHVLVDNGQISIQKEVKEGANIRIEGEEIEKGTLALAAGTKLNPPAIGFLNGLGISKVATYQNPKISIIETGNELTDPGEVLEKGKIYGSNAATLVACLQDAGHNAPKGRIADSYEQTVKGIKTAIEQNDLVILTGGISVGEYDFVGKALSELGVQEVFYKIKQKPGKPIFFGTKGNTLIFALPGNPAAVVTCFYMYVLTAIKQMTGHSSAFLEKGTASLAQDFIKKGDRAFLLKAKLSGDTVDIHTGQSSAMLSSFVNANCLIHMAENKNEYKEGDQVNIYKLP
jgi:molybdopterin molybdotransferase